MAEKIPAAGVCCDWIPAPCNDNRHDAAGDGAASVIKRFDADLFRWQGVTEEAYKDTGGGWAGIVRNVLIGQRGEAAAFDLRYFEIAPGGNSSLEKHAHVHVVIVVRGRGQVRCGGAVHDLAFLDTVYIAPDDPHQLLNPHAEPFGFFCLVDHDRDRPQLLDPGALEG